MGTKAIFKIYNEGKFVIGSWVKYDGGITNTSIFPHFIKKLKFGMDKKSIYDTINQFLNDNKFGNMFGDKKKPFSRQINDEGMNECDVLFWDNNLSDTKLMNSYVWADYVYEVRFNKKSIKIKIIYYGNVKEIEIKDGWGYEGILRNEKTTSIIKDISDWINDVDYGLNDCNCGEDNKEETL